MRALVVYESMYGNTHAVAEGIARGMRGGGEAQAVPVAEATPEAVSAADLLVVGGPTHMHGMSTERSRRVAIEAAQQPDAVLEEDPDAEGPGLREWFDALTLPSGIRAAAFDTRLHGPAVVTGRASRGIAKRLERHGATLAAPPESFLVGKDSQLDADEADRAEAWGATLAGAPAPAL